MSSPSSSSRANASADWFHRGRRRGVAALRAVRHAAPYSKPHALDSRLDHRQLVGKLAAAPFLRLHGRLETGAGLPLAPAELLAEVCVHGGRAVAVGELGAAVAQGYGRAYPVTTRTATTQGRLCDSEGMSSEPPQPVAGAPAVILTTT